MFPPTIILTTLFLSTVFVDATQITKTYTDRQNSCECEGTEVKDRFGSGPRDFSVICRKPLTANGEQIQIKMVFNGNPHTCQQYNNNKQPEFYQQLINVIGQKYCPAEGISCQPDNTKYITKMCPDLGNNHSNLIDANL